MKLKQISNHIYKLTIKTKVGIPLDVNTWFIVEGDNVYIIDTGVTSFAQTQIETAQFLGNPQAIFLTHGHLDHIEGSKVMSEALNIPIYAHESEIPYINGDLPYPNDEEITNTGVKNKVHPLPKSLNLPFTYYLTPGHTPGHVVYYHSEDEVIMCGDLFISHSSTLHTPINSYTFDMELNIESGEIIDKIKPKLITTAHGKDITYSESIYPIYKFKYANK